MREERTRNATIDSAEKKAGGKKRDNGESCGGGVNESERERRQHVRREKAQGWADPELRYASRAGAGPHFVMYWDVVRFCFLRASAFMPPSVESREQEDGGKSEKKGR